MHDSKRAEANGLVKVNLGDGRFMVVAITGTHGEDKASAWKGVPKFTGSEKDADAEIVKISNVG